MFLLVSISDAQSGSQVKFEFSDPRSNISGVGNNPMSKLQLKEMEINSLIRNASNASNAHWSFST